jgi:hypothetical protein
VRPEDRLAELGLTLPGAPRALADYELAVHAAICSSSPVMLHCATVSSRTSAKWAASSPWPRGARRVVKLFGMVNCTKDFDRLPDVIDGASSLFVALWGDAGLHARSAVGMQQLHSGMAIEIEGVFEIDDEPNRT